MGNLGTTWQMMKTAAAVLWHNKLLVILPLVAGILTWVLALILIPGQIGMGLEASGDGASGAATADDGPNLVVLFLFYIGSYFVVTFFNSALIECAFQRMTGGDATVAGGLSAATSRIDKIAGWALLAGTVGLVIDQLEKRSKGAKEVIVSTIGFAWSMATYLAVPAMIAQGLGPFAALQESVRLLKETWGEQLIGEISFSALGMLLGVIGFLVIGGIGLAAGANPLALLSDEPVSPALVTCIVVLVLYLLTLAIVISALSTVYRAALYLYADTGEAPEGFDLDALAGTIKSEITTN
jgi:hypothetical protein